MNHMFYARSRAAFAALFLSCVVCGASYCQESLKEEMFRKAKTLIDGSKYDEAIAYSDGMVSLHPDQPYPYYYLGLAYYGKNDIEKAQKNLNLAIEIEPNYPDAYYYLALIEYKKGNLKQVIDHLNEVTAQDANFQIAYYNKGVAFLTLAMPKRAMKEFAYAMYLDPTDNKSFAGMLKAAEELKMIEVDADSTISSPAEQEELDAIRNEPAPAVTGDTVSVVEAPVSGESGTPDEALPDNAEKVPQEQLSGTAWESAAGPARKSFITTPLSKEAVDLVPGREVEIKSLDRTKGSLEINFDTPQDLKGAVIKFEIKGASGGEKTRIVMRDSSTKRSPAFNMSPAPAEWTVVSFDARDAAREIDASCVENIKLEILPSPDANTPDACVAVRNFEIRK